MRMESWCSLLQHSHRRGSCDSPSGTAAYPLAHKFMRRLAECVKNSLGLTIGVCSLPGELEVVPGEVPHGAVLQGVLVFMRLGVLGRLKPPGRPGFLPSVPLLHNMTHLCVASEEPHGC